MDVDVVPRFVGRLGIADAVTVGNAALGFLAAATATADVALAARLVLLGAVADRLDGVFARRFGSTSAGPYLDSLADVATFAVAPTMLVVGLVDGGAETPALAVIAFAPSALFVAMAVVRLGLYTAYDTADTHTVACPAPSRRRRSPPACSRGSTTPWSSSSSPSPSVI